ncbi:hypothetical protein ACN28S_67320 [Cystobacter fuscus]
MPATTAIITSFTVLPVPWPMARTCSTGTGRDHATRLTGPSRPVKGEGIGTSDKSRLRAEAPGPLPPPGP